MSIIFFLVSLTLIVMTVGFPSYNMSEVYANLASDEVFSPDQYAFNVSCLGCFTP
jgi:hypothetical protein